jgi:DNA adenine methylase
MVKPFLKWAGCKQQYLEILKNLWPSNFEIYHEPFLGSGAVFAHFLPKKALLADDNEKLIFCYTFLQKKKNLKSLYELLASMFVKTTPTYYLQCRKEFNDLSHSENNELKLKAKQRVRYVALFIYLNKHCFGGLYRENQRGEFNTSYAQITKPRKCSFFKEMGEFHQLLVKPQVKLFCLDFRKAMKKVKRNDFVFLDPPYFSTFDRYTKNKFTEKDHRDLAAWLVVLDEIGAKFVLFNTDTYFTRTLYHKFTIEKVQSKMRLQKKGQKTSEILVRNF